MQIVKLDIIQFILPKTLVDITQSVLVLGGYRFLKIHYWSGWVVPLVKHLTLTLAQDMMSQLVKLSPAWNSL